MGCPYFLSPLSSVVKKGLSQGSEILNVVLSYTLVYLGVYLTYPPEIHTGGVADMLVEFVDMNGEPSDKVHACTQSCGARTPLCTSRIREILKRLQSLSYLMLKT